jgi:P27 family predicted phage terminase small subunit
MAASRLDPPASYDDEHRAVWAGAVARLTSSGRVFRADPEILGTYVEAVISHRQASALLSKTAVMITRGDKAVENPALGIQRRSAKAMADASKALGLDRMAPIADNSPVPPIAKARWCAEHQRRECSRHRQDGSWCHQYRLVAGLDVCRKHGGKNIDQLRADGQERALNEQASRELARLDVPPVVNPLDELARLAGQVVAWKDQMAGKVNELTSMRYEGGTGTEQLRAEIGLFERGMDRCMVTLTAMARLNIEDRLAGVRAATARMLEEALTMALAKSGADISGQAAAREEFKKRLKVVA